MFYVHVKQQSSYTTSRFLCVPRLSHAPRQSGWFAGWAPSGQDPWQDRKGADAAGKQCLAARSDVGVTSGTWRGGAWQWCGSSEAFDWLQHTATAECGLNMRPFGRLDVRIEAMEVMTVFNA